jgi:hypothetical protein
LQTLLFFRLAPRRHANNATSCTTRFRVASCIVLSTAISGWALQAFCDQKSFHFPEIAVGYCQYGSAPSQPALLTANTTTLIFVCRMWFSVTIESQARPGTAQLASGTTLLHQLQLLKQPLSL